MKRPWQVWLAFSVCVVGAAAAMAWLTRQAIHSDQLRQAAEAEIELEQRISLALWRMDTELAPIIAAEVVRPTGTYRRIASTAPNAPVQQQATVPANQSEYVLLHFEAHPYGDWHSPELPDPSAAEQLQQLRQAVDVSELLAKLPSSTLPSLAAVGINNFALRNAKTPAEFNRIEDELKFFENNSSRRTVGPDAPPVEPQNTIVGGKKMASKIAGFGGRGRSLQTAAQQNLINQNPVQSFPQQAESSRSPYGDQVAASTDDDRVGVSRPLWIGDHLVLGRRGTFDRQTIVQGSLLDWQPLKTRLLAQTVDLLPDADLIPVPDDAEIDPARMLAGLPVRLKLNSATISDAMSGFSPTLRWALWMGWGALAIAAIAAATLLAGVMTLSERRAAFVSSVTHELRTPLTTFRMYSEMLVRDMVPDAARRQEYLQTLQHEAERLTLLVDNVLTYARLERGRKPQMVDSISVRDLLDRVRPRLIHRAAQVGMQCEVEPNADALQSTILTDVNVVEQILFNLVDNAAKYAASAADPRIHVEAIRNGQSVQLSVRDHGPGIAFRRWSRRPQAFGKSAQESAESAPGVGLGLALCRRLARQLGGRLEVTAPPGGGTHVALSLPLA